MSTQMPSADVQPALNVAFTEDRSRLTTFFRLFMVIPHMIVGYFYAIGAMFVVFFAWIMVSITGTYPEGAYGFIGRFLRWQAGVNGYISLLTDAYPPISMSDQAMAAYPVQLGIGPRKASYSRLHAFFRLIAAIPVAIIAYAMQIVWGIGAFAAWFVIVITGKQIKGLQEFIELGISYNMRALPYYYLMTEKWPPITDPSGALPPAAPVPPLEAAPAYEAPVPPTPAPQASDVPPPADPFGR
jgi:hypothetical protein